MRGALCFAAAWFEKFSACQEPVTRGLSSTASWQAAVSVLHAAGELSHIHPLLQETLWHHPVGDPSNPYGDSFWGKNSKRRCIIIQEQERVVWLEALLSNGQEFHKTALLKA